ncbi:MAG: beta-1,6-N-acetylglucosaminyltransferase [Lachnospiraceae bacterium]|nr:beta-1,6-N-acetylglucosaminyltransferase [Lachnospiraceae bacterium]
MSKHAMRIMEHNQFNILEKLMRQLDHADNDIFIHVDKKAKDFDQHYFEQICVKSSVTFIPRMRVYWGHSSIVECELRLLEAALKEEKSYSYYHLLSGVDLQIKSNEVIHDFFDKHPDRQFLALRNTYSGIRGMSLYYLFGWLRAYNRYLAKGLETISLAVQTKILKVNRLKNVNYGICKSQQWFSITQEFARYVVEQRPFIEDFVRFTSCSDEMFLGTVLVNSPFKDQLFLEYDRTGNHVRLIDRDRAEGASPHTWLMEDWEIIEKSPYFWARKFDMNKDSEIIEKITNVW